MNYQDYDVILDVFNAIDKNDFEEAKGYLDSKFSAVILKQPVKGEEFLDIYRRIKEGIPNAKFEIVDLTSDGETFKAKIKISGTHTATIPSLKKGWKALKPTGKKINSIVTTVEFLLRSERIMEIRNLKEDKGVVAGLLGKLDLLPKNYSSN